MSADPSDLVKVPDGFGDWANRSDLLVNRTVSGWTDFPYTIAELKVIDDYLWARIVPVIPTTAVEESTSV